MYVCIERCKHIGDIRAGKVRCQARVDQTGSKIPRELGAERLLLRGKLTIRLDRKRRAAPVGIFRSRLVVTDPDGACRNTSGRRVSTESPELNKILRNDCLEFGSFGSLAFR